MQLAAARDYLSEALAFLRTITIDARIEYGASGFLPYIRIVDGGLRIDPRCPAEDALHEAGHLAVTPARWRPLCNDDISVAHAQMFDDIRTSAIEPDSAVYCAAIQAGEQEAIAWAWAAGIHLGFPHEVIISDNPDNYEGDGAGVRLMHSMSQALGIHGLAHAGFCSINAGPLPRFPQLARWTQDADLVDCRGSRPLG